jgi:diguanylate cyclase (GGDEF)-like protein
MFLYQLTLVPAIFLFFEPRHAKLQVLLTFAVLVFSILSLSYRIADPIFDLSKVQNNILTTIAVVTSCVSLYVFYFNYSRQLENRNQALTHLAQTDPLTSLSNRRHFIEEASVAEISTLSHVILLIDLDYFKSVNDNYGHLNGDLALTQSAALFIEYTQAKDLVARLGGEEFAILLRGYSSAQAFQLAQSIRLRFSEFEFKTEDESFYMTLSLGLAKLQNDYQSSLNTADQALYVA